MKRKTSVIQLCVVLLLIAFVQVSARANDGQMVRGRGFEGVIVTPAMMKEFQGGEPSMFNTGLWVPSPDLIRRAEQRLPKAIEQVTPPSKVVGTYYIPQFYTPKAGRPISTPGNRRLETNVPDSIVEDSALTEVLPELSNYKRQYLGVTVGSEKYLLMSFIYQPTISTDPYLEKTWRSRWVAVLGGGDDFWDVLYDPSTNTFSQWDL